MPDMQTTLLIEIPPDVAQQEVWDFEEQLSHVAGITTEIQEPKDIIAATLLFIHVVGPYLAQAVAVAGSIKAIHDLAQIIYDFLHPKKKETDRQQGKNKVVIITEGKRIELYNLTPKEIESVLILEQ